jgi:DNA-binding CsgD family transcriptional regulator
LAKEPGYLRRKLEVRHFELIHLNSAKSRLRSVGRALFVRNKKTGGGEPTPRELEVEDLLCRGYTQENIAAIFGRSVHTVSVQALSLYRKRGVHTQVGLLLAYLKRKGIFVFPDEAADGEVFPEAFTEKAFSQAKAKTKDDGGKTSRQRAPLEALR